MAKGRIGAAEIAGVGELCSVAFQISPFLDLPFLDSSVGKCEIIVKTLLEEPWSTDSAVNFS